MRFDPGPDVISALFVIIRAAASSPHKSSRSQNNESDPILHAADAT